MKWEILGNYIKWVRDEREKMEGIAIVAWVKSVKTESRVTL